MAEWYFVVSSDADGIRMDKIDKQELLKRFNAQGDDRYYGEETPTVPTGRIDLEEESNFFIIKGDFVDLKPKEVVQEWEIA